MNGQKISKMLLVNKPIDWTSFDVVKKIRNTIKKKYNILKLKVGHSGTLDPKASGLLIICVGQKTKEIKLFENLEKKYIGVMKLGCITDSFDSETEEKEEKEYKYLLNKDIEDMFLKFTGEQKQKPPIFSAIKINGERLYKKARRGEVNIKLKERIIIIYKLRVLEINLPFIKFEVQCSKGTYIRSLVNDIGQKLLCGAYLVSLIRTEIGNFKLEESENMNTIIDSI